MRMLNNLDQDQVQTFVGPDLGPNCLQLLSAEDTSVLFFVWGVGDTRGLNSLNPDQVIHPSTKIAGYKKIIVLLF